MPTVRRLQEKPSLPAAGVLLLIAASETYGIVGINSVPKNKPTRQLLPCGGMSSFFFFFSLPISSHLYLFVLGFFSPLSDWEAEAWKRLAGGSINLDPSFSSLWSSLQCRCQQQPPTRTPTSLQNCAKMGNETRSVYMGYLRFGFTDD